MNATAALTATTSTETFGLPPQSAHLIAKLRKMPPEQLATIIRRNDEAGREDG